MKLKSKEDRKGEKVFRYSIRKYHFGAASVAVAALMFFANGTVQAQTPDISPATESGTARTSALVSDSSGGVSEELSEKTSDTDPSQSEQSSQGNQKLQEASDENKSLVKDSEEGKGENQAETSRPTVDKSLAESAQSSLQALLANLTPDSMKELHARVEAGLAQAKAVLDNPNSSQEEVDAQVQVMKGLTEEVNKALAGGLISPAQLGEGGSATPSEATLTPKRGRGRRGQLTPPATPAPVENQETKETAEEATDYTNGSGSYPLSDKIHHLLQELKTSTENPEQVQKLKEAYDKLNEALGQSENGLVNQEVFNAALEEYKKTTQLKNGVEKGSSDSPKSRKARSADNSLKIGFGKGTTSVPQYSEETLRTLGTGEAYGNNLRVTVKSFSGKTVRSITVNGLEGTGLSQTGLTLTNGLGYVDLRGRMPADKHGYTRVTVVATDSSGNTNQTTLTIARALPDARITTTNKELEGKAETQPIISGTIGVRAEPGNTPDGAELMAYLVRGGSTNPYSYNNEAQGYHTIAKTRVTVSGTFNFVPPEYRDPKLGEGDVRVVVAYVRKGTDETFSEGMKSGFSTNSVRATAPIDREGAKRELQTKANEKKATINGIQHLTKEERDAAINKVEAALRDAKSKVDAATNQTGVEQAKQNGLTAIDSVDNPTPATHTAAYEKLDQKANEKKATINGIQHLTKEERDAAINKVEAALRDAKSKVDAATNQTGVEQAKQNGLTAIDSVDNPTPATHTAAYEKLDQKANEKKATINGIQHLTKEERDAAINKVEAALRDAKSKVDAATNQTGVEQAKQNGLTAIDSVDNPTPATHTAAYEKLDQKANEKKATINGIQHLTKEERDAAINKVEAALRDAKSKVDAATNQTGVEQAKQNGLTAIDSVDNPTPATHTAAYEKLDQKANEKKATINGIQHLTKEERDAAINKVEAALRDAKSKVDAATNQTGVEQAKQNGLTAIDSVDNPTPATHTAAYEKLDQKANEKKATINGIQHLTKEERDAAINKVEAALRDAKSKVDAATNQTGVEQAKQNGLTAIDSVDNPTPATHTAAYEKLDQKANEKKATINGIQHLTKEERDAAINKVEAALRDAKSKVDAATNQTGVEQAKQNGLTAIDSVDNPTPATHTAAYEKLDQKANEKKATINGIQHLTKEERDAAINKVEAALRDAKSKVDAATNQTGVEQAKQNGLTAIDSVDNPTPATHTAAYEKLDQKANEKKATINGIQHLTKEERDAAINKVEAALRDAKSKVDAATNQTGVEQAKQNGLTAIDSVDNPTPATHTAAYEKLDQKANEKKATINGIQHLTKEERDAAINKVEAALRDAKSKVDAATNQTGVEQAKQNGLTAIDSVDNSTPATHTAAYEKLDQKANEKKATINGIQHLTKEERDAAINKVEAALRDAKSKVDAATNQTGVEQAKQNGLTAIDSVDNPTPATHTAAYEKLDQKANEKKATINGIQHLTKEERDAAINKVEAALRDAKSKVDAATNQTGVEQAKQNGLTAIDSVDNPTPATHTAAYEKLDQKANEKKATINGIQHLTKEERDAAINKVEAALRDAKSKVDAATNQTGVEQAKQNGLTAIDSVDNSTPATHTAAYEKLDQKANEKKATINGIQHLTKEERDAAINKVEAALRDAKSKVDAATNQTGVEQAKQNGLTAIDSVDNPTPATHTAAYEKLDQKANEKKATINGIQHLTKEERDAAINKVEAALRDAKSKVDAATNQTGVEQAKQNGLTAIDSVDNPTPATHTAAYEKLDQKANEKKATINGIQHLTKEERDAAINKVEAALRDAKSKVDAATNQTGVEQAKQNGLTAIDSVDNPTPATHTAAYEKLDQKANEKKATINGIQHLTKEERDAAINKVEAALRDAKSKVDAATNQTGVEQAKQNGLTAIDSVDNPTPATHTAAYEKLDQKANEKKATINGIQHLTKEERDAAINKVEAALRDAKSKVDAATNQTGVEQAKQNGLTAIDSVDNPTPATHTAAYEKLDQKANEKKATINGIQHLTKEERDAAINKVEAALRDAKSKVDAATNQTGVEQAKQNGLTAIDSVDNPTPATHTAAYEKLDQKANEKKATINGIQHLTKEERDAAINKVEAALRDAKSKVDAATNQTGVEQAKQNGLTAIDSVDNPTPATHTAAYEKLDQKANEKKATINGIQHLTKEERDAAINKVEAALRDAKSKVDAATNQTGVEQAKQNGLTAIDSVDNPTPATHTAAYEKLDQKANEKKATINGIQHLTKEERDAAINKVEAALRDAKSKVDAATNQTGVEQAKQNGLTAIDSVDNPTPATHTAAYEKLDQKANEKKATINGIQHLTKEERDAAINKVEAALRDAKSKVDAATNQTGVEQAKQNGLTAIDSVDNPTPATHTAAYEKLDQKANEKKATINGIQHLTKEERDAAINKVEAALRDAKSKVDAATNQTGVEQAKQNGLTAIDSVDNPTPATHTAAYEKLDQKANEKKATINGIQHLTKEERDAAINKVEAALRDAKSKVDAATNQTGVEQAKQNGLTAIDSVDNPTPATHTAAYEKLDQKANEKKATINGIQHLTKEERDAAINKVEAALRDAKSKVDAATNQTGVEQAKQNGLTAIDSVDNPTPATHTAAYEKLDQKANEKKATINGIQHLTKEERDAAINKVEAALRDAKSKVDAATNQTGVEQAKQNGLTAIDSVDNPTPATHTAAYEKLDQKANEKKATINGIQHLTKEERDAAINKVEAALRDAKSKVDAATNQTGVEQAKQNGLTAIDSVDNPTPATHTAAYEKLDQKANEKKATINGIQHLTKEERDAAINKVEAALRDAKSKVDAATNQTGVEQAKQNGLTAIDSVDNPTPATHTAAYEKLDQKANEKKATINGIQHLTKEERDAAINKVEAALRDAKSKVDAATNQTGVEQAKQNGLTAIDSVDNPTPATHTAAYEKLDQKANEKKATINGIQHLTKEERDAAINKVEAALRDAKSKVDAATNQTGVEQAKQNGLTAIDSVDNPTPATHTAAYEKLDQKANEKKATINGIQHLTKEERDAAINKVEAALRDAKSKVDAATNQTGVEQAKQNGLTAIDSVDNPTPATHTAAYEKLDQKANEKKATINGIQHLTKEERDAAINKVEAALRDAKSKVDAATNQTGVEQAKQNGLTAIDSVDNPTPATHTAAYEKLDQKANEKKATINGIQHLTKEERDAAINKVEAALRDAKSKVDAATNQTGVEQAKQNGLTAIDSVDNPTPATHTAAYEKLDQKANEKKATINGIQHLTKEERDAAINKVEAALRDAKSKVDAATNQTGVEQAKQNGLTAIDSVDNPTPATHTAAYEKLDQKANEKKATINGIQHLTKEERDAAINKVEAALRDAKSKVDAATNQTGVEQAKQNGLTAIDSVDNPTPATHTAAYEKLDQKANLTLALIDENANLSLFEKEEAKNQVRQVLQDALKRIDQAKTQDEIDRAKQAALSSMDQILAEAIAKANSRRLSGQDKDGSQTPASPSDTDQSGTSPVNPPSATRNRRTPPRRARRSVGFVGNSQTGTNPSAVDKSELRTLVEDLERRLQDLAGLSPEVLEEAQRILGEAQAALDNENLTAQELADLLAKVRQVLNSLQTGTSADKSQSASNLNKEAESTKGAKNETEVPLYGVLGAAVLSLLGALLFAVARKKSSQLDKLSRELHQLVVELEASDKDKKVLNKAKKLADEARLFVDSHQKDSQKEAELISEIKTVLSQLKEEF